MASAVPPWWVAHSTPAKAVAPMATVAAHVMSMILYVRFMFILQTRRRSHRHDLCNRYRQSRLGRCLHNLGIP